ncbi:cytochrome b/b6 domain-containing protein [Thiohalomonas denitrificans]|uniref:cytochrome b/b6 domain-containing protein n=1 Tax=Thiohalomonas denitrificans TaxID=415747 RepID=UPI0026EACA9B|nr:cytochrome b/b6 domain-containing protein [Thiohalomonas denitrificans]
MNLTAEARSVLNTAMRQNHTSQKEAGDIEEVVAMLPHDRKELYRNVESNPIGDLPRYSFHIRVQHLLTFTTFLLLAFTGLPIHYHDAFWAQPFNDLLGGLPVTRIIHRTLAVIMVLSMVYHVFTLAFGSMRRISERRFSIRRTIIPTFKDIRDFRDDMLYFAGQRPERPEMDKFMYKQKIHYFAAAFGNMVMVVSGSSFLFPEMWASILPAEYASHFQEMMRLSHPHEALLALLVIAFWHWYNVHLSPGRFPMQWTFLTGKITREHQIEEHFHEYLRCLVEMPEERRIIRAMIVERGLALDPDLIRDGIAESEVTEGQSEPELLET